MKTYEELPSISGKPPTVASRDRVGLRVLAVVVSVLKGLPAWLTVGAGAVFGMFDLFDGATPQEQRFGEAAFYAVVILVAVPAVLLAVQLWAGWTSHHGTLLFVSVPLFLIDLLIFFGTIGGANEGDVLLLIPILLLWCAQGVIPAMSAHAFYQWVGASNRTSVS